jgi:hypothetical protein
METTHEYDKKEIAIMITVSVAVFVGYMVLCKVASDFGDRHFPMSRFIK